MILNNHQQNFGMYSIIEVFNFLWKMPKKSKQKSQNIKNVDNGEKCIVLVSLDIFSGPYLQIRSTIYEELGMRSKNAE